MDHLVLFGVHILEGVIVLVCTTMSLSVHLKLYL